MAIDEAAVCFVSAVNAMEIATKYRLGRLPNAERLALNFEAFVDSAGFQSLAISTSHARLAGNLPIAHKDPFDRLLIAQSMLEGLTLVSNEVIFDSYSVMRLW